MIEELLDLAHAMSRQEDISAVLTGLCGRLAGILGIAGVGVSLRKMGQMYLATADDEALEELAMVQDREGVGPCIDALESGETIAASRLSDHVERWPAYAAQAAALGVRAVAAVPTRADDILGTVDLYHNAHHDWTADELAIATLLALMATTYVSSAARMERARREIDQLQQALDRRVIIEQAKGIVAASHNITVDKAFHVLRKHARDHNAPLHLVAGAVVNLGLRL